MSIRAESRADTPLWISGNEVSEGAFHRKAKRGNKTMFKLPRTLPVRTRLPLGAWAIAAAITLFSLASSLFHAVAPGGAGMPSIERVQSQIVARLAKV
jgi:hypothetical protein